MDNICVEFFALEPTPLSAWRMAILMGANTRTYKFALGAALLELAREGREAVSLDELAVPYAELMLIHGMDFPQAPNVDDLGEADYLRILTEESEGYAETGIVSERLVDATVESVPGMVMQKFHNLRGTDGVPFRFYEIEGRGANRVVRFSPALKEVAANPGRDVVDQELNARWSLVESAFDADVGRSLIGSGLAVSSNSLDLLDKVRRKPVTGTIPALIGFQYGRCFYCHDFIDEVGPFIHVDHVYPFSLMTRMSWSGPDLNSLWNYVIAHDTCNLQKSNSLPSEQTVRRLIARNEAVIGSPHPLRRTFELILGNRASQRMNFYSHLNAAAHLLT